MRHVRLLLAISATAACLAGCSASSSDHQARPDTLGAGDSVGAQLFNSPSAQLERQVTSDRRRGSAATADGNDLR